MKRMILSRTTLLAFVVGISFSFPGCGISEGPSLLGSPTGGGGGGGGGSSLPQQGCLMGYWSFDGSLNDGIGTRHFTQKGTAPTSYSTVVKKSGSHSVYFDGVDQYLEGAFNFSAETAFTMAGWVYVQSFNPGNEIGLFGQNDLIENNLKTHGGQPRHCLWADTISGGGGGMGDFCDMGTAFSVGQWVHVAIVGSATGAKLYYNGLPSVNGAGDFGSSGMYAPRPVRVGWAISSEPGLTPETPLHGYIDELAMWNCALTDGEIQALAGI